MAGNIPGDNSGNILVEFDYNNIIIVDPNKTIDAFGKISERLVDHEKLVMFVNLEAEILPRTKLSVGATPADKIQAQTISVAKMNFLRPTEGTALTDGYYDELTGKNSTNMLGVNQIRAQYVQPPDGSKAYYNTTVNNPGQTATDNGLLGITSVNVRTNTSFVPSVTMRLEDVQGRALFQLGDNSPYSAFFNLPYCPFYLTLKGFYGQAVRYQLNLKKFNARFNSFSGNYTIDLEFVGYKFNILNEISMGHLLAAPHMYSTRFNISSAVATPQPSNKQITAQASQLGAVAKQSSISNEVVTTELVSEKGYQKILELYSEYKAKGLLAPDFPELTFAQLMNKIETFEKDIVNSYSKVDVEPLTNIRAYKELLNNYFNTIRGGQDSWFVKYINPRPIILKNTGEKVYAFNEVTLKNIKNQEYARTLLSGYTIEYNKQLAANATLGVGGTNPVKNNISYDTLIKSVALTDIDFDKTAKEQVLGLVPTDADISAVQSYLEFTLKARVEKDPYDVTSRFGQILIPSLFVFDTAGTSQPPRFTEMVRKMETEANRILSIYEAKITADFAKKLESSATGLGFKPTVRNICAVIMASTEAFIRLLDDVHTSAWNQKYNPIRRGAILDNPSSAQNPETIDYFITSPQSIANNSNTANAQIPVYPWPQYFVETPEDKKGRFQLKYIADPAEVDKTSGWDFTTWPEVQFVEEYMKGLMQKFNAPTSQPSNDNQSTTNIVNINAIEYPSQGIAYVNKEEIKFFYEIWERQFLTANYSGFIRATDSQLGQLNDLIVSAETENIVTGLGVSSPFLTFKLKNYKLTAQNYQQILSDISNQGTGNAYQQFIRDFYITPYLRTETENSFSILNLDNTGRAPLVNAKNEALLQLVKNSKNTPLIVDTYPFSNPSWVSANMASSNKSVGVEVYNTNNVLTIYPERNVISNFENLYNYTTNRPVTNFSYLTLDNPNNFLTQNNVILTGPIVVRLDTFYDSRKNPETFIPTEGYVTHFRPSRNTSVETTTSMLNTPYLVNAIQNGVDRWRRRDPYPYVQASYLFINSLPLASLRERYKTQGASNDLDYIASCFKKFGAIHKMPYAWVLKMGSIWYRYKTYVNTGVDILDTAWKNFDATTNFDPITSSDTKTYTFNFEGVNNITLQEKSTNLVRLQTGFYPKVINDFNAFYNGYDLYTNYTNEEIQASVDGGVKVYNFTNSNISSTGITNAVVSLPVTFSNLQTWSVILPNGIGDLNTNPNACQPNYNTTSTNYYVVPSFGSELNQVKTECFLNENTLFPICNFENNPAIYNGSVRLLWDAPNYGYFDNRTIVKPKPNSYVNKILSADTKQSAFRLLETDGYSNIEEIFSVFDKSILDKFEQEFLNFSKPIANIDLGPQVIVPVGENPTDGNAMFKNFQYLFRNLMTIPGKTESKTNEEYFKSIGDSQLTTFYSVIKNFMQYDVMLKYGNPSNYNRRVWASFIGSTGGNTIVDPISFSPYVKGSLPSINGGTSLTQSIVAYPQEWRTLETEVGFSTIRNLVYTSNGSYITDFFVDNNIGFTVDNIVLCAPLIKMYATQKLNSPTITSSTFKSNLQTYLNTNTAFQDVILNNILTNLQLKLPNQQQLPERAISSILDGQQSKVENYEVFKAINDKWIAGGDFKNKTLFEDIMFLDRASRNIGDTIVVDIFDLKNMLNRNSLNMEMSSYAFMSGILIKNHFNVMPLPSYVNFYNVQDVDGTTTPQADGHLEFADNMWGTFLNVDYRNSGPKIICFYAGQPSSNLDLPKGNSRVRNDGFELIRASENPLIEDYTNKKDWAVSNKVVGFNVDIGVRNQNIFYSFDVGMESGRATSETIKAQLDIVNQATGKNSATQNVGLYNLYKKRSYTCTVNCLGNALLQPTMYFNLRHVPMFYGPYLITDVQHTINAGNFQTQFTGVRQAIYDLPPIESYLQNLNESVLTQIESIVKNKSDKVSDKPITDINKTALLQQIGDNTAAAQNTCINNLVEPYNTWEVSGTTTTSLTPKDLVLAIESKTSDPNLQLLIYTLCYITTYSGGKFNGHNLNFANITLTTDYGSGGDKYFKPKISACVNISNEKNSPTSQPIAVFDSLTNFIEFMVDKLKLKVKQIFFGDGNTPPLGIEKFYACYWPKTNISPDAFDKAFHNGDYKQLTATVTNAYKSAGDAQLNINATKKAQEAAAKQKQNIDKKIAGTTNTQNNLNTTSNVPVSCPPPAVIRFTPSTGVQGTIISLTGTNLNTVTAITINNVTTTTGITINDRTTLTVVVPFSNTPIPQSDVIILRAKEGLGTSIFEFTYDPNQPAPGKTTTVPGIPPNSNTQPQQTIGPVLQSTTTKFPNGFDSKIEISRTLVGITNNYDIYSVPKTQIIFTVKRNEIGPNNTIVSKEIFTGSISENNSPYLIGGVLTYDYDDLDYFADSFNAYTTTSDDEIYFKITVTATKILTTTPLTIKDATQTFNAKIKIN